MSSTYLNGLALSGGLIIAIGAQNAHVLRMGLKRQHVGLTVLACILVDAILIGLGVAGMGALIVSVPLLLGVARWGGAAFLLCYGVRSLQAALGSATLAVDAPAASMSANQALRSVLSLSLLNPHVYLDTVVLLGAIGARFPGAERPSFALGAITASVLWFCALGYGARTLADLFRRPIAWQCLDALTGATMLTLALTMVWPAAG